MKLRGILDFSLGNFLCLRGFAPLGVLFDLSEPDPSFQRSLINEHKAEMIAFLDQGEFLFFPEVVLCTTLNPDGKEGDQVAQLFEKAQIGETIKRIRFGEFSISSAVRKARKAEESRAFNLFQTATIDLKKDFKGKFSRIDGNHRLSATPENSKFRKHNTPFCLIFFPDATGASRLSRALFHNINYKQVPLTMEQNLRLILDAEDLFSDDTLKSSESFGWPYYLARKLRNELDFDLLPNLKSFIEAAPRTFLVKQLAFLREKKVVEDNENVVKRFKGALTRVNALFDQWTDLKGSKNAGLLAALVYYELRPGVPTASFVRWILENHLQLIEQSSAPDLIAIFDKILESKKRTIFVSMPLGKAAAENHYKIIERVCDEISKANHLNPPLKAERVDWFHDGTSYEITGKILEMISDCGLLIGNLTYGNLSVYHEIGFVMGKARTQGATAANILLFLDQSVPDNADKIVGFNLQGIKQLRFTGTEEFADLLRTNLQHFFELHAE